MTLIVIKTKLHTERMHVHTKTKLFSPASANEVRLHAASMSLLITWFTFCYALSGEITVTADAECRDSTMQGNEKRVELIDVCFVIYHPTVSQHHHLRDEEQSSTIQKVCVESY